MSTHIVRHLYDIIIVIRMGDHLIREMMELAMSTDAADIVLRQTTPHHLRDLDSLWDSLILQHKIDILTLATQWKPLESHEIAEWQQSNADVTLKTVR